MKAAFDGKDENKQMVPNEGIVVVPLNDRIPDDVCRDTLSKVEGAV